MYRLFFTLLTAFLILSPLSANAGGKGDCAGAECRAYRHGVHRKIIPAKDVVCVYFIQSNAAGRVVMTIYFDDGRPPRRYDNKKHRDHICVGRDWVRDAVAITLCSDSGRAIFLDDDLKGLSLKPKRSPEFTACLKGEDACIVGGFKPLPIELRKLISRWDKDTSLPIQEGE